MPRNKLSKDLEKLARERGLLGESPPKPKSVAPMAETVANNVIVVGLNPTRYLDEITSNLLARCVHLGEPVGKSRPRFNMGTGCVYTPQKTRAHESALANLVRPHLPLGDPPADVAIGIRAVFYLGTHRRKDVDNLMKTVLDSMNKLAFRDDCQVKEIMGWSMYDPSNPRTEFVVYRMHHLIRESRACEWCGKEFRLFPSWEAKRFCSSRCNGRSLEKRVEVPCSHCGTVLSRQPCETGRGRNYCSKECKTLHTTVEYTCSGCGVTFRRAQSLNKPGQTVFYCSRPCSVKSRVGKLQNLTQEKLSARALKAWETRRSKPHDS